MRKYNSSFKTAFISEAGNKIKNNDYFGFVELDKYACYVIADGITDMRDSESAREAIEAIINAFQAAPGISKRKIKSCLRYANKELLKGESYEKLKASVTVIVTDYQKFRYGHAGNTRLRLYRDGRLHLSSSDMSLSQELADAQQLSQDKLAQHEERNNLYSYLGKEKYKPWVSKKFRLAEGDILTLYTRGIWENVDEGELADVFAEAGDEPSRECDAVEDLLLSRQPSQLDNYTFAAIYIDKVFSDPNRRKRIKKIVTITVIILAAAVIIGVIIFLWQRDRRHKYEDMEKYFSNTETYIEDNNFLRAKEECEKALELAQKLRDKDMENLYNAYLVSLEAIISADDIYAGGDYTSAKDAYLKAQARVRYADNAGLGYIEDKLYQISEYEQVFDYIEIGDMLLQLDIYEAAEKKYLAAKSKAASIHYDAGKQQALDALEKLYAEWDAANEETKKAGEQQAADEIAAAQFISQGDAAYAEGDYEGAKVFYLIALDKYTQLEDTAQIERLNKKIQALNEQQDETQLRMDEAKAMEVQARLYDEIQDYEQAKIMYQYAKAIYEELGKDNKANEVQGYIDIIDSKIAQAEKEQAEQEKEEQKKAEQERLEQERLEQERLAQEKAQAESSEQEESRHRRRPRQENTEEEESETEESKSEPEEPETEESEQEESGAAGEGDADGSEGEADGNGL